VSYLAIARKYRPTTFDEIVGQEHVTRTLKNAITRDRIHHAFLFCGARGVGKTTAARALARSLNCEKGPTPDPCGECTSCTEIQVGTSPDLIEIDGASNNSVDNVRDLRETVKYAPTQGKYKIYLVDEVHMLSKAAFNALLKTLEEPPPHVVFIFATTEPNKILDTILSRVQRFDFLRIPSSAVVDRLASIATQEGATISKDALRLIAHAGEGSMRDSQSLLDKVIAFAGPDISDEEVAETLGLIDRKLLYLMLEGLVGGQPEKCLEAIDQVYGYGFELAQFTMEMLEVTRNATFLQMSEASHRYIDLSQEEKETLQAIVRDVDHEVLTRTFTVLLDVHDQVAKASRPRIVLEMAVARLATTRPLQPIGDLVGRLQHLERQLRGQGGSSQVRPLNAGRSPRSSRRSRSSSDSSKEGDSCPPLRADQEHGAAPSSTEEEAEKKAIKTPNRPKDGQAPKAVAAPKAAGSARKTAPTEAPAQAALAPISQEAVEATPETVRAIPLPPPELQEVKKPAPAPSRKTAAAKTAKPPAEPTSTNVIAFPSAATAPPGGTSGLKKHLAQQGKIGQALAAAEWTTVDDSVRVPLIGAVLVARARRLLKTPEMAAVIRQHLGDKRKLEIVDLPAQKVGNEQEAQLQQQFLNDKHIQRMMTLFDAELIDVDTNSQE
jgi:DNA polymerase III subunit gamma/tau